MLKIENISKSYKSPQGILSILQNLNFEITQGQSIAIMGPSGCGKTTLLSLLALLDRPDSGSLIFKNQNITHLSEPESVRFRSHNIGVIFQNFQLFDHLTALDNISLALEILRHTQVSEKSLLALEQVGLKNRANHYPHQLSGGEQQRVGIARALVTSPSLLLADEPSGNLDQDTGKEIMDLLFKLVCDQKSSLIVVTHDPKLAKRCDKTYALQKGQLHDTMVS